MNVLKNIILLNMLGINNGIIKTSRIGEELITFKLLISHFDVGFINEKEFNYKSWV